MQQVNPATAMAAIEASQARKSSWSNARNRASTSEATELAKTLWAALEAEYPGRWVRNAGAAEVMVKGEPRLSSTAKRWVADLSCYELVDVRKALKFVTRERPKAGVLPSLGEMVSACREYRRERLAREDMLARETRLPRKGTAMPAELSALIGSL